MKNQRKRHLFEDAINKNREAATQISVCFCMYSICGEFDQSHKSFIESDIGSVPWGELQLVQMSVNSI